MDKSKTLPDWLTALAPSLQRPDRRQARLLASLIVFTILLGAVNVLMFLALEPEQYTGLPAAAISLGITTVAYGLSRTRHYKTAVALMIAVASGGIFAVAISADPINVNFLVYLITPVLFSSLFVSLRATTVVFVANVAGMLMLPALFPKVSLSQVILGPLSYLVIVSGLLLLTIHHRNRVERDRQAELVESETHYRQWFEQSQAGLAETQALYGVSRSLIAFESLRDLLQAVVDSVAAALPADRVTLITFDLATRQTTHFVKGGPGISQVVHVSFDELWNGLSGWVLRELKPALSPKTSPDPRESPEIQQRRAETNCGAIIVVPLRYRDKTLGTLTAINRPDERDFTQRDVELMAAMASQAAVAIENARLYEEAQQEIAERVRAEEELQRAKEAADEARRAAEAASRVKSAFLASMSHELRTPLNAILGYAQILKRRPSVGADVIDGLNIVQQSGEHLLTLVNDILDIVEIEAGRTELLPVSVHFPAFLEHIASLIRARAQAKGLTFNLERLSTLPTWLQADETRLQQVLLNLLDNAVKFTDTGHVAFRVQCLDALEPVDAQHPKSRVLLRFEVQDTGLGIPPDQLERIFLPFEQAEDVTRWIKGMGLGLAISRRLVRLMGGELHVESEPGQGSIFWFEVTLPTMEGTVEMAQLPERVITGYKGPRRTLLVVDDVPSNRALLVDLLQPLGFEVLEAADGQQAIHLAQETRPDLILMDRWMPVLDGFETARRMRQIPELKEIPVIAISSSASKEDQAQSRQAGIDAFLPKPVNWPNLAALLEEHLDLEWESLGPHWPSPAPPVQVGAGDEEEMEMGRLRGDREEKDALLVSPPREELAILHHLAKMGNMRALQERAAHIEALGEQYVPFARQLRELARGFEERQILALIEQNMADGTAGRGESQG